MVPLILFKKIMAVAFFVDEKVAVRKVTKNLFSAL